MLTPTIRVFDYSDLNIDIENVDSLQLLSKPSSIAWILLGTLMEGMVKYHKANYEITDNNRLLNLIQKLEIIPDIIMSSAFSNMRSHIWEKFNKKICLRDPGECNLKHNDDSKSINLKNGEYEKHFHEISIVGKGGFGQVYKALHYLDKQIYAIKKIKFSSFMQAYALLDVQSTNKTINKTLREVKILASCNHPNIVRYYNSWIETEIFHHLNYMHKDNKNVDRSSFNVIQEDLVMEDSLNFHNYESLKVTLMIQMHYYPTSLRSFLATRDCGKMLDKHQTKLSTHLYLNILSGLQYLHAVAHIIHRDIKPENIFLDTKVNPITAVIGDFGLAIKTVTNNELEAPYQKSYHTEDKFQGHTHGVGTNLYAAPEQLLSSNRDDLYDNKVDIYSVGMVAYELFNFFATDSERIKLLQNLRTSNKVAADIMEQLPLHAKQVMECCQIDPQKRPNAQQLKDDILKWHDC